MTTLYTGVLLLDVLRVLAEAPEDQRAQYEAFTGNKWSIDGVAKHIVGLTGPKWTIALPNKPVAVAGYVPIAPGVYRDWMVTTGEPISISKHVREVMEDMLKLGARRLECVSLASRVRAHRWYGTIGYELEGTMRKYGTGGEDALLFSRVEK